MDAQEGLGEAIGRRLRQLRKERGLTLAKLGAATDLSPAVLSRIENGLIMPPIPTLQRISSALKIDISLFFSQQELRRFVVSRQGKRKVTYSERGSTGKPTYEVERLAEGFHNPFMEPIVATLLARNHRDFKAVMHGGQELLYVLEGKLELSLGDRTFILKKGDAVYYDANIPHKGISLSKKPAKTLNVNLIPGSRLQMFEGVD